MAVTVFRDWAPADLAQAVLALVNGLGGFITDDEKMALRLVLVPAMQGAVENVQQKLRGGAWSHQDIVDALYDAFVAGWACRGAAEAILHDEVPRHASWVG